MFKHRDYVGLDVHKKTITTRVAWPGRKEPEYWGISVLSRIGPDRLFKSD